MTSSFPNAIKTFAMGAGLSLFAFLPSDGLAQNACGASVQVVAGDTLGRIADRCGTSVAALQQANPGVNPYGMQIGDRIVLPQPGGAEAELAAVDGSEPPRRPLPVGEGRHVQEGDTVESIAAEFNVTPEQLIAANPGLDRAGPEIGTIVWSPTVSEQGLIEIAGMLTEEDPQCMTVLSDDGEIYSLIGDVSTYGAGDRVQIRAKPMDVSVCTEGMTLDISAMRPINDGAEYALAPQEP